MNKKRGTRGAKLAWSDVYERIDKSNIKESQKAIIKEIFKSGYLDGGIEYETTLTRRRKIIDINAIITTAIGDNLRGISVTTIGKIIGKHHATVLHYNSLYSNTLCFISKYRKIYDRFSMMCMNDGYDFDDEVLDTFNLNTTSSLKAALMECQKENSNLKRILKDVSKLVKVQETNISKSPDLQS